LAFVRNLDDPKHLMYTVVAATIAARPEFVMTLVRSRSFAPSLGLWVQMFVSVGATGSALAQSGACVLSPDKHNPSDQILRCGSEITISPAPGTQFHQIPARQDRVPSSVQLDSGALLIEFHAKQRREFQILTPTTIASVRGTKWATEVKPGQSSTLVLEGRVIVKRKSTAQMVVLGPGEGVDVFSGIAAEKKGVGKASRLEVKRWAPVRVKALLARFGE
jgi:hypothetical protein